MNRHPMTILYNIEIHNYIIYTKPFILTYMKNTDMKMAGEQIYRFSKQTTESSTIESNHHLYKIKINQPLRRQTSVLTGYCTNVAMMVLTPAIKSKAHIPWLVLVQSLPDRQFAFLIYLSKIGMKYEFNIHIKSTLERRPR